MAKKNDAQSYAVGTETGTAAPAKPKKKKTWLWIVLAVIVLIIIIPKGGSKNKKEEGEEIASNTATEANKTDKAENAEPDEQPAEEPEAAEQSAAEPDLSGIETVYTLSAGQYYAGIDIPCGKFDLIAVSGSGNVHCSNLYEGGISGLYAHPGDGPDYYDEAYNGVKLPEGERINICSDLVVKITYSRIDAGFTGRTEDTANTITLIQGNYDVGTDIPEGLYTIRITEGSGHIGYNVYDGGLNETMAAPGEAENRSISYIPEFKNAYLPAGDELTIRGMTVELVPMIPGVTP